MSYVQKAGKWLLTDSGRRFCYYLVGGTSTTLLCACTLPHTIFLDKYKDFLHLYKHGSQVSLTSKLQNTFNKALELTGVPARERHLYKPFACYGFDIFSAGSSYSKFGVIVGLPEHFLYESASTIPKESIKLSHDESNFWELEEGELFRKSLILSEKAQIYAIAREIKMKDTIKPLLDMGVTVSSFLGAYGVASSYNMKLNLYTRPLTVRLVLYSLVSALAFGSYALCKDFSQIYYEKKVDEELKSLDPIFVEGGREFYAKILERNKALRKFLGKEGEKLYSILGNENYFLRYKHMPLVDRKALFDAENLA